MKRLFIALSILALAGCAGSGGPAQKTGRSIDHGVQKVGAGVEHVGAKIKDSSE